MLQQYASIQTDYEKLSEKEKGKQKHFKILQILQKKYFKTFRSLEYVIFREYENKNKRSINTNQLNLFDNDTAKIS